jgi:anti-anti-sigma regulatory factor
VVFSFFKKDPKNPKQRPAREGNAARAEPTARSNAPASRPPAVRATPLDGVPPEREVARSLAMETAAKIDAIESEMTRDFLRPSGRNTGGPITAAPPPMTGNPALVEAEPALKLVPKAEQRRAEVDDFDPGSDVLAGSVDAIEINTSGAGSIIDETAILFSNGQIDAAEAVLRAGIRADDLAHATHNAWLMLFELVNQRGDKKAFEQLTMEYVLRFENAPPGWFDYIDAPAREPRAAAVAPVATGAEPAVRLPEKIDAGVVKQLEELKQLATSHAALKLDFSAVRSIDLVGAELLLRVVNAFKRARHELVLAGAEQFLGPLRSATEPGRRDASDALWMLLLEVLRVLDRQEEFDETAIQYCITFEVSPPSWEPAPPNIKPGPATAFEPMPVIDAAVDFFEWRGAIEGEGEPHFGRLLAAAAANPQLIVECAQLRRMAFSAASAMLTLARRVQKAGSALELRNVNPMITALLHLLGVTGVATVQPRRG